MKLLKSTNVKDRDHPDAHWRYLLALAGADKFREEAPEEWLRQIKNTQSEILQFYHARDSHV